MPFPAGCAVALLTAAATVQVVEGPGSLVGFTTAHPPPAHAFIGTNEPPDHIPIVRRRFSGPREARGWDDGPRERIEYLHDPGAPASPPGFARMLFRRGHPGGVAPAHAEYRFGSRRYRQIYIAYWFRVSDNWYGHGVVSKIGYAWIGGRPKYYAGLIGEGYADLRLQSRLQDLTARSEQGGNLRLQRSRGRVWRDRWHKVEILLRANTPGARDGIVRWWVDGYFVGAADDIGFVGEGDAPYWEGVSWRPVWGGQGGQIPVDQHMDMDELYISGSAEDGA